MPEQYLIVFLLGVLVGLLISPRPNSSIGELDEPEKGRPKNIEKLSQGGDCDGD